MRKIPTLFRRDLTDRRNPVLTAEVTPGCEWVLAGEGTATRKYDGTCVAFLGGVWWARREVKPGKPTPERFVLVQHDPATGKTVGWVPVEESDFHRWFRQAVDETPATTWVEGTYELIGPKVNGNPEGADVHVLVRHDDAEAVKPFSRTFEGIRDTVLLLAEREGFEGLVWHHPDGRMAKIKARDFGAIR